MFLFVVLVILGIAIAVFIIALLLSLIIDDSDKMDYDLYYNSKKTKHKKINDFPRIKFSIFKKYYFINPESWELRSERVIKGHDGSITSKDPCFTFNFIDFWKYKIFLKTLQKQEKHKEDDKVYIKLLELVQEDINKLKSQTIKDNTEAMNTVIEVNKRLKEEI